MNRHIKELYDIANKPSRMVIGLMSGTSLDGLDVALCRISGQGLTTTLELLEFETIAYDKDYKDKVKTVFAKRDVDLQQVCLLNPWIGLSHGEMVMSCLQKWNMTASDIDLIASHGQTIYHCPKSQHHLDDFPNATLQIGDGDHISHSTEIITLSDFRQKHIAAGGEGAPLAVYGDYLLFASPTENRVMLNLGGIANLTYLPKSENDHTMFSSDVGPGNGMMDALIQKHTPNQYFDKDARIARSGKPCDPLLAALKNHPFFKYPLPKTTGPEIFNLPYLEQAQIKSGTQNLGLEDIMATLNIFSATMIAHALNSYGEKLGNYKVYASGGGVQNPLLMDNIKTQLGNKEIKTTESLNIDPHAKEAILFAILANECVAGEQAQLGKMTEGIPPVTMGKISFPD